MSADVFPDSEVCEACEVRFPITEMHSVEDYWLCGSCLAEAIADQTPRLVSLKDGLHRGDGYYDLIGCTADRYRPAEAPAEPSDDEELEDLFDQYDALIAKTPSARKSASVGGAHLNKVLDLRDAIEARATRSLRADLSRTQEALRELSKAAQEVNSRYIGGSPLGGALGDALGQLATAEVKARPALMEPTP